MNITIEEFLYTVAALRLHDEMVQPKKKTEPWLWQHYGFGQDDHGNAFAYFIGTGDEPPFQPGIMGSIQ
jgi:hypothetical protein